jgi:hypothetical protein
MQRLALCFIVVVALCTMPVAAAGGKTPVAQATIALNVPASQVQSFTATMWPILGDSVTFSVTFPKSVEKNGARIQLVCYQGETVVYGEAGPYNTTFLLGGSSSEWLNTSNGPAHCVADLYYWSYQGGQKFNWLASTEFDAGGK